MPFNGTGTFTLVSGNPVVTGTNISSTVQNNTMSDFANGFTNCITRDGQSAPTSNLPMGNQRHTGAANASGAGEYLVYGQTLPATTVASLAVTGAATVGTTLGVTGNTTLGGTLDVTGVATFTATPAGKVTSGTYTPTLTNGADVSASSASACQWLRDGDSVTVSGRVSITNTSNIANQFSLGVSLPVASNFAATSNAGGVGVDFTTATTARLVEILADTTNDRATFTGRVAVGAVAYSYSFSFTYQVI